MQKGIFIDKDKCVGCYSCVVACKLKHNLPPFLSRPPEAEPEGPCLMRVYEIGPEKGKEKEINYYFQPVSCMHCLDAPCIKTCPRNALLKDEETGVTCVDQDKCIGCKLCLLSCPFGAPQFYEKKAMLCNLCIDLVPLEGDDRQQTACEAICPARAIMVGDIEDISHKKGTSVARLLGKKDR